MVFPAYLEAMVSREDFYLSDLELLALARCTHQNLVIFIHHVESMSLTYVRSFVSDAASPVRAVSVRECGESSAVRSHFERLDLVIPRSDVRDDAEHRRK